MGSIGLDLRGLAMRALGVEIDLQDFTAACVPISSGLGLTKGFSESVCSIARHIGLDCRVTSSTDVTGLTEAMDSGADLFFMADDDNFIALNARERRSVNNVQATVVGYCTALEAAVGDLNGEDVLVIGAGRLGTYAIGLLQAKGAHVTIVESDRARARLASQRFNVEVKDMEEGLRSSYVILNLSPAHISGRWINEGSIVSSPGMPYTYDALGESKIKTLIHDPLQIGVATMAVWTASFSCLSGGDRFSPEPAQTGPGRGTVVDRSGDKPLIETLQCL